MSELDPDDNSYDSVDVFTTGTIGRPGQRTFYLQVRIGHDHVDVKCEKIQVAAMAEHLRNVLQDLPPVRDRPLPGALEMASPPHERFVLGQIGLGYDPRADQVVVQLEELGELDDEGPLHRRPHVVDLPPVIADPKQAAELGTGYRGVVPEFQLGYYFLVSS